MKTNIKKIVSLEEIKKIEEELILLDKNLLKDDKKNLNHEKIISRLFLIRKKLLELEINLNEMELSNTNNHIVNKLKKKINNAQNNINIIDNYNTKILQAKQKKTIDTLTLINTIFLPLSLITGFFGMNFKSMGVPSLKTGIYTTKNSSFIILILFLLISLITTLLFKYNEIPDQMIIL